MSGPETETPTKEALTIFPVGRKRLAYGTVGRLPPMPHSLKYPTMPYYRDTMGLAQIQKGEMF